MSPTAAKSLISSLQRFLFQRQKRSCWAAAPTQRAELRRRASQAVAADTSRPPPPHPASRKSRWRVGRAPGAEPTRRSTTGARRPTTSPWPTPPTPTPRPPNCRPPSLALTPGPWTTGTTRSLTSTGPRDQILLRLTLRRENCRNQCFVSEFSEFSQEIISDFRVFCKKHLPVVICVPACHMIGLQ